MYVKRGVDNKSCFGLVFRGSGLGARGSGSGSGAVCRADARRAFQCAKAGARGRIHPKFTILRRDANALPVARVPSRTENRVLPACR
jgi:hypothetical protein